MSDAPSARFPSRARLHRSAEFQTVFSSGRRFSSAHLRLHAQPRPECSEARLGVTVSKRVDKRAVGRNRIKRVLRDVFRRHRHQLPVGDYVLVAKPDARGLASAALRDELAQLFARAHALKPLAPAGTMPGSAGTPSPAP